MTLRGAHPVDEDAVESLGVLSERLEHLKAKSPLFERVAFSEEARRLAGRSAAVAVN